MQSGEYHSCGASVDVAIALLEVCSAGDNYIYADSLEVSRLDFP